METFGTRLRKLRTREGLTQKQLGEKFGISESAVGMYERDQREPSLDLVRKFADYFQVSMDYIMGRDFQARENQPRYPGEEDWTEEERKLAEAFIRTLRSSEGKRP